MLIFSGSSPKFALKLVEFVSKKWKKKCLKKLLENFGLGSFFKQINLTIGHRTSECLQFQENYQ